MQLNKQSLLKDIEAHRNEMVTQATHSSLSNDKVIKLSKKLDNLLNKYDRLLKNSSNS
ncbi:aspartyl-phosphate phosphatase Spo0E family protein [Robertmurraya korlensis]|uniref:aspartyl-phosphate phosphatase Spo0E family protein n=1 Tax=Robertmurraya korlensis TaxID=519977 RepID=UPI001E5A1C39|nr:aspartyl-phosphate phosphatase Spo0E family protein [Robertmurraya korlensis]